MANVFYSHPGSRSTYTQRAHAMGRADFLDEQIHRQKKRRITFYPQGSLLKLSGLPGWEMYEGSVKGIRGKCSGFTSKAASRLMALCNMLNRQALPVFVTLTYPREFPNPRESKKHLNTFFVWLRRYNPEASAIWKLEPQQRGAAHYHLMVFGCGFLPWYMIQLRWAEICGGFTLNLWQGMRHWFPEEARGRLEDEADNALSRGVITEDQKNHLLAGTRVEVIRSRNGIMAYTSKLYMGKPVAGGPEWDDAGRYWGIIGRAKLPLSERVHFDVEKPEMDRFRRLVRRWSKAKGRTIPDLGAVRIYSSNQAQWSRALDFCITGLSTPLDMTKTHGRTEKDWIGESLQVEPF